MATLTKYTQEKLTKAAFSWHFCENQLMSHCSMQYIIIESLATLEKMYTCEQITTPQKVNIKGRGRNKIGDVTRL